LILSHATLEKNSSFLKIIKVVEIVVKLNVSLITKINVFFLKSQSIFKLNLIAFEIDLFAIDAASSLASSFVERFERVSGLTLENEARCVASELTENAMTTNVR
jgi:hypothetical protein